MEHPFLLDWLSRNKVSLGFGETCSSASVSRQLREVTVGWEGADAQRNLEAFDNPAFKSSCAEHPPLFLQGSQCHPFVLSYVLSWAFVS